MDDEQGNVSIDDIRLWRVACLKDFLRRRKLKVSGRKDELVATVYGVLQNPDAYPSVPPSSPATEEIVRKQALGKLLKTKDGSVLPDPALLTGWESQTSSLTKWPPTMSSDIGWYLRNIDNVPLAKRLMSDYKEGKAYSYFASGWVKDLQYNEISSESKHCFLRTECVPSQRINNIPWKVWVSLDKKSGEIQNAYCTCFAGFSGTCNHVAAILFKIDFAWKEGLTNPACTAKECGWSAFGSKHRVEPMRIKDVTWSKPHFSKRDQCDDKGINPPIRKLFSPLGARSTSRRPRTLQDVAQALYPDFKEACSFAYINTQADTSASYNPPSPSSDINVGLHAEVETSALPTPLDTLAEHAVCVEDFLRDLPTYSSSATSQLERATRGQAANPEWFRQRKGRITSSVCHNTMTKGRKLLDSKGKSTDCSKLVTNLLYASPNENLPALKYGRDMEGAARAKYRTVKREGGHKNCKVIDCGLKVKSDKVYLGSSPDGLVSCDCCGEGLLEIKCPYSVSHTAPTTANIQYVTQDGTLKKSHPYYSQVQFHMGVWEKMWCDFFVYTTHGNLCIRVPFDEERWSELVVTCEHFFKVKLAKELATREHLQAEY